MPNQKTQAAPAVAPAPSLVPAAVPGAPADPAADAKLEDAKREALSAIFRIEPIGWDARGRRYWNFPWSGGDFAVEIPRLPRTRGTPYHKQGSNRCVCVCVCVCGRIINKEGTCLCVLVRACG